MSKHKDVYDKYPWLGYGDVWNRRGFGRWMKKRLSKARRHYIKDVIKLGPNNARMRGLPGIESDVNWKGS